MFATIITFRTSSLNEFRYNLPYRELVGGGLAISGSQFRSVNGFSNQFYGWGGEDDELYQRLTENDLDPVRVAAHQARYISLKHHKQSPPSDRGLAQAQDNTRDGLTTLQYHRKDVTRLPMCTVVRVTV